jgi:hypothetical protein
MEREKPPQWFNILAPLTIGVGFGRVYTSGHDPSPPDPEPPMRIHLPALAAALVVLSTLPAAEPDSIPIPPRIVQLDMSHSTLGKVAPALSKAAEIPFTFPETSAAQPCEAPFASGRPFWEALELVADQTGNRIVLHDGGRKIALADRGKSREVSSIRGPFRVVAERVTARTLLDDGVTIYEVLLNTHWEPRFPVFRIDAEPAITKAADDRGVALTGSGGKARSQPAGAAAHAATVRLSGLTRESRKIATLDGYFTVTASAKMLSFRFPDLAAKTPVTLTWFKLTDQSLETLRNKNLPEGVLSRLTPLKDKELQRINLESELARLLSADEKDKFLNLIVNHAVTLHSLESVTPVLKRFAKDENTWEAELELTYPPTVPAFESFESWTTENRARLVSPEGKSFTPNEYATSAVGAKVSATYYFKEDPAKGLVSPTAKGWALVYDAPTTPIEFPVPFELKDIPLP